MRALLTREQSELLDQTLNLAKSYLRLEAEICEALREIDRTKLYKKLGHRSLFQYVTDRLGFSASVAYAFVSVTRKSEVIPALQDAIEKKHLTVSKASRIVSCLTPENAAALIEFAGMHSCRETEQEITRLNPKASRPDRIRPVAENLNAIQGTILVQVNVKFKRVESLIAQKGKATDLNSVLEAVLDEYLKHHDPVEKASRAIARRARISAKSERKSAEKCMAERKAESKPIFTSTASETTSGNSKAATELLRTRKKQQVVRAVDYYRKTDHSKATPLLQSEIDSLSVLASAQSHLSTASQPRLSVTTPKRVPLTAEQKHFVFHRDQGRCTHLDEIGKRCGSDRWIDFHHIVEVSRGGTNEPSNLTLLCSFHHEAVHQLSLALDAGQFNWLREPRYRYS